jgi:hypothetical protein
VCERADHIVVSRPLVENAIKNSLYCFTPA